MYAISVLRDSSGEREILARPDIKIMDTEPQRAHLNFVLFPLGRHVKVCKMYPTEIGLKDQKIKNKPIIQSLSKDDLEHV